MDTFRAIYHDDPGDAHAAAAVDQVAELLAEQGRELKDEKSLKDAAGQYAFLRKAYPQSAAAKHAPQTEMAAAKQPVARNATASPRERSLGTTGPSAGGFREGAG